MAHPAWTLSRGQLLRALPKHLLLALLSGAVVGVLIYWLKDIQALPGWVLLIIMGTLWANAAVIPVALPGRYWSFAFIGALMLFLLLVAGMHLALMLPFPHSRMLGVADPDDSDVVILVNVFTYATILTGGCLGLVYGLLAGQRAAMVVGLALGGACGYVLGLGSLLAIRILSGNEAYPWRFDGALHFAWQGALAMLWLHLGAGLGAVLGARPTANRRSKIENPNS
jgi:hypothetical protein